VRKASLSICGAVFLSLSVAVACSSTTDPTLGSGTKDGGSSGSSGSSGAEVDARRPYPSFRDDVVPIVQESCALTACHSSKESNLGIFLAYEPAQIYAEFQKTSPTAAGQKFVVPGDITKSYLIVKLEGKQAALASSCPNMSCGTVMPPDDPLTAAKIDTFKKWITEGAKDD
jgi:hypothetical protein